MVSRSIPLGEAIAFGWETFKNNALFLIGLFVAVAVITGAVEAASEYEAVRSSYFSAVLDVISFLVEIVLEMGLIAIMLKFKDGSNPEFVDLFSRITVMFQYAVAFILYGLMILGGLVALIVPGIYLAIRFCFFGYFIVDEGSGPIEALKKSSRLTEGVKVDLLFLGLVLIGLNIVGLMCLLVGLFVSMPVSALAIAYVFRHLQGAPPSGQGQPASQAT